MTIILMLKKVVSIFLASILLLITPTCTPEPHSAKNPDEIKLNFTVLSDCHIEGNNLETFRIFHKILKNVKSTEGKNDAVVFLGDNTMNGQDIESMFFYGAIDRIKPSENILVAMGNHDIGNGIGDYVTLSSRYMDYNNMFFDMELSKPYYYKVINGCYFIVLATEQMTVNTMYISDEQISWLEDVLAEAQKSDNPIFVFNHHPLTSVEEDSMKIANVLSGIDNLIYIHGHTHWELGDWTFGETAGINTINVPRTTEHPVDGYDCGIGMQIEVYEDEVIVRTRDFYDDFWVEDYEVSYPIG